VVASVVLTALFFAALHASHVLTNDVSRSSALLLVLQAVVVSVWWGALVVVGKSIWPRRLPRSNSGVFRKRMA